MCITAPPTNAKRVLLNKDVMMDYKAILFGSIGTLVETSELQRRAFNQAFAEAGLDWNWTTEEYRRLLTKSGGCKRIQDFATQRGSEVDVKQLHHQKTIIFDRLMANETILLRPGAADIIRHALDNGLRLGFVTNTSEANIDAVFFAVANQLNRSDFNFIGNDKIASNPKPNPEIYLKALSELHLDAQHCIAIEDTQVSMRAALAADIRCIAFPGAFAEDNDFSGAVLVTQRLCISELTTIGH
jgi:beta-phosphoglucomutase-like phosphatase (HAD superfamily)|tara:strand:- start:2454 stop:3182 length:729 start_codon:yes stop_codon:yes gene_type:complete